MMFGRKTALPPLSAATGALPARPEGGLIPGAVATMLKGIGIDPVQLIAMAEGMLGELRRHNDLLAAMNAKLDTLAIRIERQDARTVELENLMRLTNPEANMMLTERDTMLCQAARGEE